MTALSCYIGLWAAALTGQGERLCHGLMSARHLDVSPSPELALWSLSEED